MSGRRRDDQGIRRILVKGTNWVGDTVISFPAVHALRHLFPTAHIAVLVRSHLADLWRVQPAVDEVITYDIPKGINRLFAEVKIAGLIRNRGIGLAIIFPRSFSSAWMVFLGGIPRRLGYKGDHRGWLLTNRVEREDGLLRRHRMYYYLHLIERLGDFPPPPLPTLRTDAEMEGWTDRFLDQHGISGRLVIGLNPGATYGEAKCWPPDRFVKLGKRLIKDDGASLVVFGSPRDAERRLCAEIAQEIGPGCIDLSGQTSLLQLASLLRRCRLLVTNDTGTMHVAAAVGTKVVAIFGPTDPTTTSPLGEGHIIVRKEAACIPCLKRVCPIDHRCMRLVEVDDVYEAIASCLARGLTGQ